MKAIILRVVLLSCGAALFGVSVARIMEIDLILGVTALFGVAMIIMSMEI